MTEGNTAPVKHHSLYTLYILYTLKDKPLFLSFFWKIHKNKTIKKPFYDLYSAYIF